MVRSYTECGVTRHDKSLDKRGGNMIRSYTSCGVTLHDKSLDKRGRGFVQILDVHSNKACHITGYKY